jgi:hypothetical protein
LIELATRLDDVFFGYFSDLAMARTDSRLHSGLLSC